MRSLTVRLIVCLILAAVVCQVFYPVVRNGFAGYDDEEYVTANPRVNTGLTRENAAWALKAAHSNNWHPLTWMSHQLDTSLFGLSPAGHHAVNLGFHVVNTVLVFLWLAGMTAATGRSAFVALIFGLHPLHVESVAWIAERKDVLSGFFALLALLAYTAYTRKPGTLRYLAVAALFALGLMSKPMLVTLPVLLLVLDWWPLGRDPRIVEKLPLFALSALSAAATLWAQAAAIGGLPPGMRLANATLSYIRYLGKTVWPVDLAAFYPFPLNGIAPWKVAASAAALAGVTAAVFLLRRRHPWLAAGWCWYLVTLLPVIGIVQVGMQSMADRYMYVPMLGLLIAAAWEAERLDRRVAAAAAALAAIGCGVASWRQIPVWKDGLTLFTHAIAVTRDNFVAHDNLGVELDRRGRAEEALVHYRETVRIKPGDRIGENNLAHAAFAKGERLFNENKPDEAIASFQEGMRYRTPNAAVHAYIGQILVGRRQFANAMERFRAALEADPALVRAHVGLGIALANTGNDTEARKSFEMAVKHDPSSVEARFNLGVVLAAQGRMPEAIRQFQEILKIKPDYVPARQILAVLTAR
jgi:protein O-mannosyl-transferase